MSHLGRSWGPLKTPFGCYGPSKGSSGTILSPGRLQVADFPFTIGGGGPVGEARRRWGD